MLPRNKLRGLASLEIATRLKYDKRDTEEIPHIIRLVLDDSREGSGATAHHLAQELKVVLSGLDEELVFQKENTIYYMLHVGIKGDYLRDGDGDLLFNGLEVLRKAADQFRENPHNMPDWIEQDGFHIDQDSAQSFLDFESFLPNHAEALQRITTQLRNGDRDYRGLPLVWFRIEGKPHSSHPEKL